MLYLSHLHQLMPALKVGEKGIVSFVFVGDCRLIEGVSLINVRATYKVKHGVKLQS